MSYHWPQPKYMGSIEERRLYTREMPEINT